MKNQEKTRVWHEREKKTSVCACACVCVRVCVCEREKVLLVKTINKILTYFDYIMFEWMWQSFLLPSANKWLYDTHHTDFALLVERRVAIMYTGIYNH